GVPGSVGVWGSRPWACAGRPWTCAPASAAEPRRLPRQEPSTGGKTGPRRTRRGPFFFQAEEPMGHVIGLKCRECGREQAKEPVAACDRCWGALLPVYDLERARRTFNRETIATRPRDLWRYRELLPVDGEELLGRGTGFTPLVPALRLGRRL